MFFYLWATLPEINILYLISYILYILFTSFGVYNDSICWVSRQHASQICLQVSITAGCVRSNGTIMYIMFFHKIMLPWVLILDT